MSINKYQLQELIDDILIEVNLYSTDASNLLMGTAATESQLGTYIKQLGKGPALGIFQMEPFTFHDLIDRFSGRCPYIKDFKVEELRYNLRTAIIMARIKYLSIKQPLPPGNNLLEMAKYWKQWYNTPKGAGTMADFMHCYSKYIL